MSTAAVIIIGNEILSGRTQDANLAFIGKRLESLGINLLEACIIPDDEEIIINTTRNYKERFTYIFTTGGIGPTHDDITTASIAKLFNVPLEKNPKAVASLERHYGSAPINEARMKMAYIPANAILIKNPVSGAPGFQIGNVFVLPGIPQILQVMFDGITDRLVGGPPILSRNISTNLRESSLAQGLGFLQSRFTTVSIGSYPYFKKGRPGINLVMRSTISSDLEDIYSEIEQLILQTGGKILDSDTE